LTPKKIQGMTPDKSAVRSNERTDAAGKSNTVVTFTDIGLPEEDWITTVNLFRSLGFVTDGGPSARDENHMMIHILKCLKALMDVQSRRGALQEQKSRTFYAALSSLCYFSSSDVAYKSTQLRSHSIVGGEPLEVAKGVSPLSVDCEQIITEEGYTIKDFETFRLHLLYHTIVHKIIPDDQLEGVNCVAKELAGFEKKLVKNSNRSIGHIAAELGKSSSQPC
jgi:hypothetical protein